MFGIRKWMKWALRKRSPRVFLIPLHNVKFKSDEPDFMNARIKNASTQGLGFFTDSLTAVPHKGQLIEGSFTTPLGETSITFEIVHITGNTVGVRVTSNLEQYETCVLKYLAREMEATEMHEVRPTSVRQHPDGNTRLWNGGEDCSLYLVTNPENQIVLFELIFYGNVVSGGHHLRFLKASYNSQDQARFKSFGGSQIMSDAEGISEDLRDGLTKFIYNIQNLDPGQAQEIVQLLNKQVNAA